ncbi:helix-turn-helix domain-containing protein [Olivibacter jilunii]|uniref:helix-turn-helix domain-containing protein n=1 Tax=Olivibacter jilunii TaxID=985016 RepID=UPI00103187F9|nr:AraC family transcriptional regulator [Olivibacter jilunii]
MKTVEYIETGNLVFSVHTEKKREKDGFLADTILTFQLSGQLFLETASEKIVTCADDIVLIRKNQMVKVVKSPFEGDNYKTVTIVFKEEVLRNFALKHSIEINQKYRGKLNVFIPQNDLLKGFLTSILPYGDKPQTLITITLAQLKVEEAIELLLQAMPGLEYILFDFSEPYKMDLEKFMLLNYRFNVPVERFAQLTGRSLAGFKRDFQTTFGIPPRKWLQHKRLSEAHYLLESHHKKPSDIYLELGFESLSHFTNAFKVRYGMTPTQIKMTTKTAAVNRS